MLEDYPELLKRYNHKREKWLNKQKQKFFKRQATAQNHKKQKKMQSRLHKSEIPV